MAEPSDDLADKWQTVAAQAQTLCGTPSQTIEPDGDGDGLPLLHGASAHDRFDIGAVLGEGGMGIVRAAVQRSMGRSVAIKALRPGTRDPADVRKLIGEAWAAGQLEHPNIVPIYDIAMDEHGNPLVVLKRIEGESWARLLRDPTLAVDYVDGDDPLDRNLRILRQVCRAAHFAHSRGIVHLDIKPENVMLGRHGEVYLVDWGIAMALREDGALRIPATSAYRGIVGTPQYLAPEMLEGDGARLSASTDVYLLGATLFEILAGHPPHRGATIMEVLHAAVMEEPSLPASVPAELAEICMRALARDPAERYASAEELRRDLEAFDRHRESGRISARALTALEELERAAETSDTSERTPQILFAQARFGFEQALSSWPDNEDASRGLARAFRVMVRFELERGNPQVSAALAREAPALPDDLRDRVERAVATQRAGLEELALRRRDQDLRIGQRTRVFVFGIMGLLWTVVPVVEHVVGPTRTESEAYLVYTAVPLMSILMLGALATWARYSLTRTRVNRLLVGAVFVGLFAQVSLVIGGRMLGLPPMIPIVFSPLLWALAATSVVALDRRVLPVSITYLAGFFGAAARPDDTFAILAACNLVLALCIVTVWRPARLIGPIPDPDPNERP